MHLVPCIRPCFIAWNCKSEENRFSKKTFLLACSTLKYGELSLHRLPGKRQSITRWDNYPEGTNYCDKCVIMNHSILGGSTKETQGSAAHNGSGQPIIGTEVLGRLLLRLFVSSHYSLNCLLCPACFTLLALLACFAALICSLICLLTHCRAYQKMNA